MPPIDSNTIDKRGTFILFEGCDRAGKSTQANKLFEYLQSNGHSVKLWKFPERTTRIGQMIDAYLTNNEELDDRVIHLLFSANRWECIKCMKELLLSGTTLIVDRYAYSGVSFSVAKGLDLDWCRSPDVGLLSPDITFFLDLKTEEAEKRRGFGEERYEKKSLQEKVRKIFFMLKEKDSNNGSLWKVWKEKVRKIFFILKEKDNDNNSLRKIWKEKVRKIFFMLKEKDSDNEWKILNASQSVEELHEQIVKISLKLIEECNQLPLKDLWKAGNAFSI